MTELIAKCDNCLKPENRLELYCVPGNMEFLFFCKNCWDKIDTQEYYKRIKAEFDPAIYSEREYNSHRKATIAIGFSRTAVIDDKAILPVNFEEAICKDVENEFFNKKILDKFNIHDYNTMLRKEHQYQYTVIITAIVSFKDYKQFLEHELYKCMRKEVDFRIN